MDRRPAAFAMDSSEWQEQSEQDRQGVLRLSTALGLSKLLRRLDKDCCGNSVVAGREGGRAECGRGAGGETAHRERDGIVEWATDGCCGDGDGCALPGQNDRSGGAQAESEVADEFVQRAGCAAEKIPVAAIGRNDRLAAKGKGDAGQSGYSVRHRGCTEHG